MDCIYYAESQSSICLVADDTFADDGAFHIPVLNVFDSVVTKS
jgi:hypothetical protein